MHNRSAQHSADSGCAARHKAASLLRTRPLCCCRVRACLWAEPSVLATCMETLRACLLTARPALVRPALPPRLLPPVRHEAPGGWHLEVQGLQQDPGWRRLCAQVSRRRRLIACCAACCLTGGRAANRHSLGRGHHASRSGQRASLVRGGDHGSGWMQLSRLSSMQPRRRRQLPRCSLPP